MKQFDQVKSEQKVSNRSVTAHFSQVAAARGFPLVRGLTLAANRCPVANRGGLKSLTKPVGSKGKQCCPLFALPLK